MFRFTESSFCQFDNQEDILKSFSSASHIRPFPGSYTIRIYVPIYIHTDVCASVYICSCASVFAAVKLQ